MSTTPQDAIHTHTTIMLDWRDRLRALVGRPIHVHTTTPTSCVIPEPHFPSEVSVYVEPLWRSSAPMAATEGRR